VVCMKKAWEMGGNCVWRDGIDCWQG